MIEVKVNEDKTEVIVNVVEADLAAIGTLTNQIATLNETIATMQQQIEALQGGDSEPSGFPYTFPFTLS